MRAGELDSSNRPLRVMHVLGGRVRSGVETFVLALAEVQRREGHEPIFVPLAEGPFTEEAQDLGFRIAPLLKRRRLDVLSIPRLARLIRDHRPDVLHSYAVNGAFYACPAGRLIGFPAHVGHFQADTAESLEDVIRWRLPRSLANRYHIWLTRWCRQVIVVSPKLQSDLIRAGVPTEKVEYIPNAIDVEALDAAGEARDAVRTELGLAPQTVVVGTVCRLSAFKNLPLMLRAAKRLVEKNLDVRFVLAGDGPERAMLEQMALELEIADKVHFTGWRSDVTGVLSALDVFALTSKTEGLPLAVLEAMALGKPTVATDVGGVGEAVRNRETGLLVPSGDVGGIADALELMIADRATAQRMGAKGRALVEREFSSTAVAAKVMNVYRRML